MQAAGSGQSVGAAGGCCALGRDVAHLPCGPARCTVGTDGWCIKWLPHFAPQRLLQCGCGALTSISMVRVHGIRPSPHTSHSPWLVTSAALLAPRPAGPHELRPPVRACVQGGCCMRFPGSWPAGATPAMLHLGRPSWRDSHRRGSLLVLVAAVPNVVCNCPHPSSPDRGPHHRGVRVADQRREGAVSAAPDHAAHGAVGAAARAAPLPAGRERRRRVRLLHG